MERQTNCLLVKDCRRPPDGFLCRGDHSSWLSGKVPSDTECSIQGFSCGENLIEQTDTFCFSSFDKVT